LEKNKKKKKKKKKRPHKKGKARNSRDFDPERQKSYGGKEGRKGRIAERRGYMRKKNTAQMEKRRGVVIGKKTGEKVSPPRTGERNHRRKTATNGLGSDHDY